MHVMKLGIYELPENQLREGQTFPVDVNEIAFTHVPYNYVILKVKNSLVKYVCYNIKSCLCWWEKLPLTTVFLVTHSVFLDYVCPLGQGFAQW